MIFKTGWRFDLILIGAVAGLSFSSCESSHLEAPERVGPPSLVVHENEPHLWLLLKQEEKKVRSVGFGSRRTSQLITEIFHHFDLQSHDTRTANRLWKKRLLTVKDKEGGFTAEARILGQDGEIVWLFLRDQPVAVSSRDGSILADRALLEQRNAALQGLLSKEERFYTFDRGLVITTADSRRFKVGTDFTAAPYLLASDQASSGRQSRSTQSSGSYRTGDFLTRQGMLNGRWLGLYTEKEAADAGDDSFGDKMTDPSRVIRESSGARRTFWTARIGKTKEFTEGSHDRLFDLTEVPDAPDFLDGGLLVRQGTRKPLTLKEPAGLLVLHRTRVDQEGRAALTRVDESLHEKWTARLPFLELRNRFEFSDRLLLYGVVQETTRGVTSSTEHLVALDLRDGKLQEWNVPLERRAD